MQTLSVGIHYQFILSTFFALTFTLLCLAIVRPPNRPAYYLAGYLLFFTHILAVHLVANSFYLLASRPFVLGLQFTLTSFMGIVWWRRGRPPVFAPRRETIAIAAPKKIIAAIKSAPEVWMLGAAVVGAFAIGAVMIWIVPPNNHDSLSTHLSRVGFWLQNGSFFPWPIINTKEIFYPINASLQVYWTVLFWGSDQLAGYVQWFGGITTIVGVFGIARLLGWGRSQSAFAALLWASFPIVMLQSTTTQLDLVAAAIFLPSVYFLYLGIKTGRRDAFAFSGLSLALALGTKQTIYFLLPGFGLLLMLLVRYWRKHILHLVTWVTCTTVFFLLLSSYIFFVNYGYFGTPVGPPEVVENSTIQATGGSMVAKLLYNIPRLAYQAVDFSGLPRQVQLIGILYKARILEKLTAPLHFSLEDPIAIAAGHPFPLREFPWLVGSEDQSWFGIIGVLILIPAVAIQLVYGIRQKDVLRIGLVLIAGLALPVEVVLRPGWDPYQGRYFIAVAVLVAPLMASLGGVTLVSRLVRWISVTIAILTLVLITLTNPAKPLNNPWINLLTASRGQLQANQDETMGGYLYIIDRSLPVDTVVGFYSRKYIWDYPLFGEHFTRRVIPIVSEDQLGNEEWLKSKGVQYVLVDVSEGYPVNLQRKLVPYDEVKGAWMLYTWSRIMK
ncbi:MAG: glycosyltransferase family 39 protein [Anaerolineaceae bacterium]|nr:glycosyltransferase family 39 protein [Anaerolineaceae bacterium]